MRMGTEAIYTKREADGLSAEMQVKHGGYWTTEQRGNKWRAYQVITREEQEVLSARTALQPSLDWFSKEGFSNVYKERDQQLDKFAADFAKDLFYATRWDTDTCQAAADHMVVCSIISYLEKGVSCEDICRNFEQAADREHESLSCSNNPMSNLMEQAQRIAIRKYAKQMRDWLNHRAEAVGTLYAANL